MIFENFPLGGLGNCWPTVGLAFGGLKKLRGAEDFDEFCKNVLEKSSNIE